MRKPFGGPPDRRRVDLSPPDRTGCRRPLFPRRGRPAVPFKTMKGSYRLNGKVREVELQVRPPTAFDANREDRTLVLTERGGKNDASRYSKFEY